MPYYSYKIALDVLSETDKNHIIALYLSSDLPNVDWQRATTAFGAASIDSMRVMTRGALKKIEKAGGKEDVDSTEAAPPKKAASKASRAAPKRKAAEAVAVADDEDDDAVVAKPTPKKRSKKAKSDVAVFEDGTADADDDEAATAAVKPVSKTPRGRLKKTAVFEKVKEEVYDDDEFDGDNINVASGKKSLTHDSRDGEANNDEAEDDVTLSAERDEDADMDDGDGEEEDEDLV